MKKYGNVTRPLQGLYSARLVYTIDENGIRNGAYVFEQEMSFAMLAFSLMGGKFVRRVIDECLRDGERFERENGFLPREVNVRGLSSAGVFYTEARK